MPKLAVQGEVEPTVTEKKSKYRWAVDAGHYCIHLRLEPRQYPPSHNLNTTHYRPKDPRTAPLLRGWTDWKTSGGASGPMNVGWGAKGAAPSTPRVVGEMVTLEEDTAPQESPRVKTVMRRTSLPTSEASGRLDSARGAPAAGSGVSLTSAPSGKGLLASGTGAGDRVSGAV